jgi:hypothetical protein
MRKIALAFAFACISQSSFADPVEDFYKGKQIQLIVGYEPGGGYDIYARLIARHLGRLMPGTPGVIVQNMPGAGSLRSANYIYTVAPKDGTALAAFALTIPLMGVLGGNANVQFDSRKFTWLGSPTSGQNDSYMLWIRKDAKVKSLSDALKKDGPQLILGGLAEGSFETDVATLMRKTIGLNFKMVTGYTGAGGLNLALEQKEIEGRFTGLSSILLTNPKWLAADSNMMPLLQFARTTRIASFPDVPLASEMAKDDLSRQLIELAEISFVLSRPLVAPPDIPADRAKALQKAFLDLSKDQDFLADAALLKLDISPVGADLAMNLLDKLAQAPIELKDEIRTLLLPKN